MNSPLLTVIIPTLKRPTTLRWTLQTVVSQDYDNFRIIVSDNFSNDETTDVVATFQDSRITYINPGKKLSMSHHWEFALSHVKSGFVTVLGDDDGMIPGGLKRIATIINSNKGIEAIGWRFGNFNWKGLPPYFMIPMANYYKVVESGAEIKEVLSKNIYQTITFPSLYGGFISVDLISRLKTKFNGTFFHSRIPDFFSGALVAASVKKYVRAEFPITINATSKFSTGFATINEKNDQSAFLDLTKQEENIAFHKKLIFIRSNAIPIAEAMLQVHELVPTFPELNISKVLHEVLDEASHTESEAKFKELIAGVKSIAQMNGIEDQLTGVLQTVQHEPIPATVKNKFSPVSITLYVDTTNTNIDNVADACNFAGDVIPQKIFRFTGPVSRNWARLVAARKYLFLKFFSNKRRYF